MPFPFPARVFVFILPIVVVNSFPNRLPRILGQDAEGLAARSHRLADQIGRTLDNGVGIAVFEALTDPGNGVLRFPFFIYIIPLLNQNVKYRYNSLSSSPER